MFDDADYWKRVWDVGLLGYGRGRHISSYIQWSPFSAKFDRDAGLHKDALTGPLSLHGCIF
jgi:hypothetical protein